MIRIIDIEIKNFFKRIIGMIDFGSSCSEILKEVNEQPKKIRAIFNGMPILTLKTGKDKILKEQLTKIKIGFDLNNLPSNKLNDFDWFMAFLKSGEEK